ncbi:MAG TPA: efflux RND transporter periplasmic adaptor subunit [Terriglobia bacterium]|nr:efflux RND transporter periplasmic adaptor subunit [Terriglobia bacterium]
MISRTPMAKASTLAVVLLCCVPNSALAQLPVTGILRPVNEVIIKSELAGVVQQISVKEGDLVREGQLLIELDNAHQKLNLQLYQTITLKAKAAVEETKVVLANAETEHERIQMAANALPRKELEDIRDQVLRLKSSLAAQMAELARAEQEVKLREQELKDTQILAPFDATVTEIFIHKGESLRPLDTPILQLVGLDDLFAEMRLPSNFISKIKLRQTIKVQVEGEWLGRIGTLDGQITYINPTVDAASRTFKVKIGVPARGLVRPGMLVEARFGP